MQLRSQVLQTRLRWLQTRLWNQWEVATLQAEGRAVAADGVDL